MGKDFYYSKKRVIERELFKQSKDAAGKNITKLCVLGPADELNQTANTQPCLATVSILMYNAFINEVLGKPYAVTGHGLGFISSLYAAESLSFEDTIALAAIRGAYMQCEIPEGEYGMSAIIGMKREKIKEYDKEINPLNVYVANDNSLEQITIAGLKENLEQAGNLAKEKYKAKKARLLENISTPFHTPYMKEAAKGLENAVQQINFSNPSCKVISNITAKPLSYGHQIKDDIPNQICSKLKWTESMQFLLKNKVDCFVSFGPGKGLENLMKRIDDKAKFYSIQDIESLEKTIKVIRKK